MSHGTCLCGKVQYEVGGPFSLMAHCHCSMCRKHHGSLFATFVAAPLSNFQWTSGEDNITTFSSSDAGKRSFCKTCGSVTPLISPEMGLAICPAGNLDGDLGVKPEMHMFVGSKATWHTITDTLPQYEAWPPDFDGAIVARPPVEHTPGTVGGSCLCGGIVFEVTGPIIRMQNCHCARCRRGRSAAHATNMFMKAEDFRWMRGQDLLVSYKLPDARFFTVAFCKRCGSAMPYESRERSIVIVPCGSLDTDPGVRPFSHIFTDYRAPWFEITDSLPRYPEAPPPIAPPPRAT